MDKNRTAAEILHWLDVEIDRLHEEEQTDPSSAFKEEEAKHIRGYVARYVGDRNDQE